MGLALWSGATAVALLAATAPMQKQGRHGDWVFIVVPAGHHRVRRLRLGARLRRSLAICGLIALVLTMWGLVEVALWRTQAGRLPRAAGEVARLERQLAHVEADLQVLDRSLKEIETTTLRVQAITQLNDKERNLRMGPLDADGARPGPVLYAKGERTDAEDEVLDGRLGTTVLDHALAHSQALANAVEQKQQSVLGFLAGHEGLLRTTPSIYPTESHLIGSPFGARVDPFTGRQVVHKGIDILADLGSAVVAPADGRVVFAGARGEGYGTVVVLDHGFGVQTHFAHLQQVTAKVGERLARGAAFAEVGRSGRTLGTYLHYEVRFHGIPEDPERFLLNP